MKWELNEDKRKLISTKKFLHLKADDLRNARVAVDKASTFLLTRIPLGNMQ